MCCNSRPAKAFVALLLLWAAVLPAAARAQDLFAGSDDGAINRYDGQTGAAKPSVGNGGARFVPAGSGGLGALVGGLAFGPDNNLYVADNCTDGEQALSVKQAILR